MEQLLQRYIRGKVSEEERLKVVSWLDESPDNMREFLALRKLYDISLWHTDTEQKTLHKKFIMPRLFFCKLLFNVLYRGLNLIFF